MAVAERAGFGVDFEQGVHPLVQAFHSVVIFLANGDTGTITGPDLSAVARWIPEWEHWYRCAAGIDDRRRLHLMYHRELSIATPITLAQWHMLRNIARACQDVNLNFGLTLDLRDASQDVEATLSMFAEGLIQGVALSYDGVDPIPPNATGVLGGAFQAGLHVTIVGSIRLLLASGILSAGALNGHHVTIEPTRDHASRDASTRVEPCFRRFRVCIDEDGDLYPCPALVGLRDVRLGNIAEPLEQTVFGARPARLDLNALARQGPLLSLDGTHPGESTGLPLLCEMHRAEIEKNGAHSSVNRNLLQR